MAVVPAHCDHCGHTWQPRNTIEFHGSAQVTMNNSRVSCPRCGGMARLLEGTFAVRDEVLQVLSAPDWTLEKLEELSGVLAWARTRLAEDPEGALARVAEVDRRVGGLLLTRLESGWSKDDTWKLIMALIAVLAILIPVLTRDGGISEEEVRRIVDQQVDQLELPTE